MDQLKKGQLETATEMVLAVQRGEVRAFDLVERALRRAAEWQPLSNSFSQLWFEEAIDEARQLDSIADGKLPLAGIPLAVKDLFDVAGHETTGCCKAYSGNIPDHDAHVIRLVRHAGMVIIGKTNQGELGADASNLISAYGPTHNPWNLDRITGGSSGGSAAVVAAGIVPLSLGSDTGGSIRIPASMCGTFGLRPTIGQVSTEGMMPLAPSLDCPGPIGTTVEDTWLMYRTMALRPLQVPAREGLLSAPRRLRIGLLLDRVHPDVATVVEATATTLEEAGVEVTEFRCPNFADAREVSNRVGYSEAVPLHPLLWERRDLVDPRVMARFDSAKALRPEELAWAVRRREEIKGWFMQNLPGVDAFLIPTVPYAAPRIDQQRVELGQEGLIMQVTAEGPGDLTCAVALAGLPAMNLPAGRSSDGLPIGASLVAAPHQELTIFRLAALWEASSSYHPTTPTSPG
jgi:Asp-tRNA(Asn)/Glu-tRNA(Gln) amidotransferase A subunit family amidase